MEHLTDREKDIFLFICEYHQEHGFSPSMRDICRGCFLSSIRSASIYIDRLVQKGYIEYTPRICRSIVIK